jgi:NAD(P)-dependent dehydrogenase (short-subunit alcohol dehydrogenase family)
VALSALATGVSNDVVTPPDKKSHPDHGRGRWNWPRGGAPLCRRRGDGHRRRLGRRGGRRDGWDGADVAEPTAVRLLFGTTAARHARLDGLFNNAGIVLGGTAEDTSLEDWERSLRVNLTSMYLCCREAIPIMKQQGGGVILNTASVAGLVGVKNRLAYSASKAGVVGLTKSIAMDYVADGIRCNCLCPGTVDSPSWRRRVAASPDPEAALQDMIARQPMGRVGTPDEIAALAAYLVSDEAAYTTGTAVFIDGGLSL